MICPVILWRPCFPEGRIRQASAGIFGTDSSEISLCLLEVCRSKPKGTQEVDLQEGKESYQPRTHSSRWETEAQRWNIYAPVFGRK